MLQRLADKNMDFAPQDTDTWEKARIWLDKTSLQTAKNIIHAGIGFNTKNIKAPTVQTHPSDTDTHPRRRFIVACAMGRGGLQWLVCICGASAIRVDNMLKFSWRRRSTSEAKQDVWTTSLHQKWTLTYHFNIQSQRSDPEDVLHCMNRQRKCVNFTN